MIGVEVPFNNKSTSGCYFQTSQSSSLQYYKTFWQGCIRSQDVFHIPNRATIAVDVIQESSTRLSTRYRACKEYSIGTQDMSPKANMKPNPSSRMSHVVNMEDWNNNIKLLWNLKIKNGSCEFKVIQQLFLIWVLADSLNTVNKNHPYGYLTAFVLIVSAHLYYAGKFTSQAMDSAILDVQWPLFFFWWINFLYDFLHLAKKWRKWLYKSEAWIFLQNAPDYWIMLIMLMLSSSFKVIPQYCIVHPYCA